MLDDYLPGDEGFVPEQVKHAKQVRIAIVKPEEGVIAAYVLKGTGAKNGSGIKAIN